MPNLEQVRSEVDELEKKVGNLELHYNELRMIEITAMRLSSVLRRMSGSEEIDVAIARVERLIMTIRLAQATIHAFEMATGPVGWAFAAVGLVTTALSVGDTLVELRAH